MTNYAKFLNGIAIGALSLSIAAAQTSGSHQGQGQAGAQSGTQSGAQSGAQSGGSHEGHGQTGAQSGARSNTASGSASATGTGSGSSMVGKQDQMFMMEAARGGMMEVQVAQLAQQKAQSDEVKQYARKLEQDHTKANEELKKIAAERQVQLPTDLGHHAAQLAKFQNMSGEQFDREWLRMQVQHHKKDVSDFRKQSNRSMDSDLKQFASSNLPVLEQHLAEAQRLQASTGTRSRSASK